MKKPWYRLYAAVAVTVAMGLNFLPQFVGYDESPTAFGPVDSYRVDSEIPSRCHLQGVPAGYDYKGWPLVSHGPHDECRTNRSLYVGNTAVNTIIASGAVAAAWLMIKLTRKRSTK